MQTKNLISICALAIFLIVALWQNKTLAQNVGDTWGGGIVGYILQPGDPGYSATVRHGLIVSDVDLVTVRPGVYGTGIGWCSNDQKYCKINFLGTSTSFGSGLANTKTIVGVCGDGSAASLCYNYNGGGYHDWFLPSRDELIKIFPKCNTGYYAKGLTLTEYWSSSEKKNIDPTAPTSTDAYFVIITLSKNTMDKKSFGHNVRAVRAF